MRTGYGPGVDEPTFLDALDADAREALIAAGRPRRYPRGSLVFAEGDEGHDVLVVQSGAVKVVVGAPNGRDVILDVLHPGEILGELSAVDGGVRSATVLALEPTEVLVVSQDRFQELLREHSSIGRSLLGVLSLRLRGAARRQLEFGANDAIGRVCLRIIDLRQRYGQVQADGRVVVQVPFSQADLANWAGLSREAVVKGLRSLRSLGWIDSDGNRITVLDEPALADRASR
jgi:CRP-like cAMP-binding protein